jgi:hypothetical protein
MDEEFSNAIAAAREILTHGGLRQLWYFDDMPGWTLALWTAGLLSRENLLGIKDADYFA